jgi:hypothetical protein
MGAFRERVINGRGRVVEIIHHTFTISVLSLAVISGEFVYYQNAQRLYKHKYDHGNTLR